MGVSKEQLDEYIRLYKEEFGVELSRNEAAIRAQEVLHLYEKLLGDTNL